MASARDPGKTWQLEASCARRLASFMTVEYCMVSSLPVSRGRTLVRVAAVVILVCAGCTSREEERTRSVAPAAATPAPAAKAERPRIVVLGDSLTAGLGLSPEESYPAILQARVDDEGFNYEVVNAGVSGDTSAGGLRRLDWSLSGDVRMLVVALGGNDGLRGLPVNELRSNLDAIVKQAKSRKIDVVLAGMEAPPNFGKRYTDDFRAVYRSIAQDEHVALVPFLLEGVAGIDAMNQSDGIHPTAEGARVAAANVWKVLEPLLKSKAAD
jgi:acyl-CoA thioesterase-1